MLPHTLSPSPLTKHHPHPPPSPSPPHHPHASFPTFPSPTPNPISPTLRLSMSALMGDPDPYPWVFFCLLLQPGSLKDPSYGLPIPIGAWVPMGYSYRWILIGTYRYTYGYLYRGYIIDVHLLII